MELRITPPPRASGDSTNFGFLKGMVIMMKKRLLSVLLACVLAFSFISPVMAGDIFIPASTVKFIGQIGQANMLEIDTGIAVGDENPPGEISKYPVLYILKDGALTLIRSLNADSCNFSRIKNYDSNGNASPYQAYIQLIYTDAEYKAFDFTSVYVLKIPTGIYKDVSGNQMEIKYVSFHGSDIKNARYELTVFGKIYEKFDDYLHMYKGTPFFNIWYTPFLNVTNYLFGILNIHLTKPWPIL